MKYSAGVINGLLNPFVIYLNKYRANDFWGCYQIQIEFSDLWFGELRKFFKSLKAYQYSSIQVKSFTWSKTLKKARQRSVDFEINRLSVVMCLVSYCTSFLKVGCYMLSMVWIFFEFASIPRLVTRNLKNLPAVTPKMHAIRFNFI